MIADFLKKLRAFQDELRKWRTPLTVAAAAVFILGLVVSIRALGIDYRDLSWAPVLLILLVLTPASLALAAVNLQFSAQAVDRRIDFRTAFFLSAFSRIVELLPAPGGAMVRGGALMRAGASLRESALIVSVAAVLTLSMSVALAGAALIAADNMIGYPVLAGGLCAAIISVKKISAMGGVVLAVKMSAVRIAILAVTVVRITAAFAVLGVAVDPLQSAIFAVCAKVGNSAAIVPAGLGVSEALAAALAVLVDIAPGSAFLAIAANRLIGLAASGLIVMLVFARGKFKWSVS